MTDHEINNMTLEELRAIELFGEAAKFNAVVIVPMPDIHDSGYRCMKFILMNRGEVVGCVSGWSDVLHINGIGGYGLNWEETMKTGMTKVVDWSIDCLPESGCLRLFCARGTQCKLPPFVGSDLEVFVEPS